MKNTFGRYFQPGKSLSAEIQEQILDLSAEGRSLRKIGRMVGVENTDTIKNVITCNGQLNKNTKVLAKAHRWISLPPTTYRTSTRNECI